MRPRVQSPVPRTERQKNRGIEGGGKRALETKNMREKETETTKEASLFLLEMEWVKVSLLVDLILACI